MDFDKRIVTLKELQRVVNELEQKAFDNEKKVSDIEHNLQAHILQYNLRIKTEKREKKQLQKKIFAEAAMIGSEEENVGTPHTGKFKKAVTITAGRISTQRKSIAAFNSLLTDIRNEGQTSEQQDTDAEAKNRAIKGTIPNSVSIAQPNEITIPETIIQQIEDRLNNSQPIKRMIIESIQRMQHDLDSKLREQLELLRPKESMNLKDKMAKQLKEQVHKAQMQAHEELLNKLTSDFTILNSKITDLQSAIQSQSNINQRPLTAESKIPNDNEKSMTKINSNATPKQIEENMKRADTKNANLFRSLKSSSNISSDGQNTNASEEVRTKPHASAQSGLLGNSRIFESLRTKLEHLDQQKVEIYEFEVLKGDLLQRISDLEINLAQDVKDFEKRFESSLLETHENIRKLRDFMLQIKESTRATEFPYAKKSETEETLKRLEKRIDMLTDSVMRNSIGPLQEIVVKQGATIKNNQSANGHISSENINEQNSQPHQEAGRMTELGERSPSRFSPTITGGGGRNLMEYRELQRQRLNNTTLEPAIAGQHLHHHQYSNDGCLDCLAPHAYRRGHNRNGYLQKKTTAKSSNTKQLLRQSLKGPLTQTLMGQQQIFKQKDALAQATFLQDTYQLLNAGGLTIKMAKKTRGGNRMIDTTQGHIQHELEMAACSLPHHRNVLTTATVSPKKVRESWSNMPQKQNQLQAYQTREILSEDGENPVDHVSFGTHKFSNKPATAAAFYNQQIIPKSAIQQVSGREQQTFKVRTATTTLVSPHSRVPPPQSWREQQTAIRESDEHATVNKASPINLRVTPQFPTKNGAADQDGKGQAIKTQIVKSSTLQH